MKRGKASRLIRETVETAGYALLCAIMAAGIAIFIVAPVLALLLHLTTR